MLRGLRSVWRSCACACACDEVQVQSQVQLLFLSGLVSLVCIYTHLEVRFRNLNRTIVRIGNGQCGQCRSDAHQSIHSSIY
jgi:hypothetical protein